MDSSALHSAGSQFSDELALVAVKPLGDLLLVLLGHSRSLLHALFPPETAGSYAA